MALDTGNADPPALRPLPSALDFGAVALADGLVTHASHCKALLLRPFCLLTKTPLFYQREYLDRTELKRDVLRALIFYYRHGYRDAVVDTLVQPPSATKVGVVFRVTEGPPTTLAHRVAEPARSRLVRAAQPGRAGAARPAIVASACRVR